MCIQLGKTKQRLFFVLDIEFFRTKFNGSKYLPVGSAKPFEFAALKIFLDQLFDM